MVSQNRGELVTLKQIDMYLLLAHLLTFGYHSRKYILRGRISLVTMQFYTFKHTSK